MAEEKNRDLLSTIDSLVQFFYGLFVEVRDGFRYRQIPWGSCVWVSLLVTAVVVHHWDYFLLKSYHLEIFYPKTFSFYWVYYFLCASSGFWLWALARAYKRSNRKRLLDYNFRNIGLKSQLNKTPQFVHEGQILKEVYKLELKAPGFSKKRFVSLQSELETSFRFYIDDIKENIEKGTFEIIYARKALESPFKISDIRNLCSDTFVIGKSRLKEIKVDLQNVPHLLVAGETSGGKSTFLRQFTTTLYLNNPLYQFILIDLKEGLESQFFEGLKRVKICSDVAQASLELIKMPELLKNRLTTIREAGCVDFPSYLSKMGKEAQFNRLIIVIDEAAELMLSSLSRKANEAQLVKKAASQIARQGRGAGVHIVFSTQRPDVRTIPAEIKSNLIGTICFQTPNDATSITALGNGKATELSSIKGRAIWKVGSEMTEVQTPLLTPEELKELLKEEKRELPNKTGPIRPMNKPSRSTQDIPPLE